MRSLLLVWSVVLSLSGASCSGPASGPAPRTRPPPLVATAKVEARDVPVTVSAPVDLRPLFVAEVGAKALGYLGSVLVDRGDKVKRGQLLATVRPSDLPDQMAAERGALAQIQASLALARSNYERGKALSPAGLVSQAELQQQAAAVAAAEASEAGSQARLEALATRLGETRIESPLDGVVAARKLDPGALVGNPTSGAIVTVMQIDRLRVFVSVNEREVGRVKVGQKALVELDAFPDRPLEGAVVRLSPAFDPTTRTLDAEVQLDNPGGELRPGMYGRGAIVLEVHPKAAVVPVSAVVFSTNGSYAFVVDGDKARRRPVTIGVDGGEWLEVTQGLVPGDEVITAGTDGLADGATIRVFRAEKPQESREASMRVQPNP